MMFRPVRSSAILGLLLSACVCFLGSPSALSAQQPPAPPAASPAADQAQAPAGTAPVIRKEARLVLVDVVVMDKRGKYVHDLKQED